MRPEEDEQRFETAAKEIRSMRTIGHATQRRTALITGASGGIGKEFARLIAREGHDLVLVARRERQLKELANELRLHHKVIVRWYAMDLSLHGASTGLWTHLADDGITVDILINNAGCGTHGPFGATAADVLAQMLELNMVASTILLRLALAGMVERRWGRILNVASLAAYQPGGPGMAAYYATKSYILSLSKGLADELRSTGVSVTALCPGPTASSFAANAHADDTGLYRNVSMLSASAVAHAGYVGMQKGRKVVIPGIAAKLLAFAGELPPRRIALALNRRLLRRRKDDDVTSPDVRPSFSNPQPAGKNALSRRG